LTFNPSFIFAGKRYAYTSIDEDANPVIGELDPYVLVNAFLNYKSLFGTGFNIGAGVYDLTNERPGIAQAYNGGYGPIPGRSREYVVKISYQVNFKK
jgi:outer membrane receptor protein involved in Fe transport